MVTIQSRGSDVDRKKTKKDKRRDKKREKERKKEREKEREKKDKRKHKKLKRKENKKEQKEQKDKKQRIEIRKHDNPNPTYPLCRVPRCRKCFRKAQRFNASESNPHNRGRPYYICLRCTGSLTVDGTRIEGNFITFDDNIGVRREHRLCDCSLFCRRGVAGFGSTGSGRKYLQCPIGTYGYFRWMDSIGMEWDGVEDIDTRNIDQHQADSPCSIRRALSDAHDHPSTSGNGMKVKKEEEEEVTYGPAIEIHTTFFEADLASLKAQPEDTSPLTVLQGSRKRRKIECDDGHALRVKEEVRDEEAVALRGHAAIKQELDIEQETALASAPLQSYPHWSLNPLPPQPNRRAITDRDLAPNLERFQIPIIKQESTLPHQTITGHAPALLFPNPAEPVKHFPNHPVRPARHRARAPSPSLAAPPHSPSPPQIDQFLASHRPPSPASLSAFQHGMREARKLAQLAALNARKTRDEQQSLNAQKPHQNKNNQPQSHSPHTREGQDSHEQKHNDAELFNFPDGRPGLTGAQLRVLKRCIGSWDGNEELWRPFIRDRADYLRIYGTIA